MALTKTAAAPAPAAAFEPMDDDTAQVAQPHAAAANDAPKVAAPAPAPVAAAPAPVAAKPAPAATAVAARPASAVVVPLNQLRTILDESKDQIPAEALESMGFGSVPRITAAPGAFQIDKVATGDKIEVELLSWNYLHLITTGVKDKNNAEANRLIRNSYDGVNLTGNEGTVLDYIAKLKVEMGYPDAQSKIYVEIYGNLRWTSKNGEIAVEDQKMVQLSLSPQSVGRWQAYLLEKRMATKLGKEVSPILVIEAESKTNNGNTYGVMKFGAKR